jgi:hypothetical protein
MEMTQILVGTEAELNQAIATVDAASSGNYTITFTANITEGTDTGTLISYGETTLSAPPDLYAINLASSVSLTIDGANFALDGAGLYRGFLAYSGSVTIANLTITNAKAIGGNGGGGYGGGGAGLGGGLLVAANATVTLQSVQFTNDAATGGNGGGAGFPAQAPAFGGGGGLGGNGGAAAPVSVGGGGGGGGGAGATASGGQGGVGGGNNGHFGTLLERDSEVMAVARLMAKIWAVHLAAAVAAATMVPLSAQVVVAAVRTGLQAAQPPAAPEGGAVEAVAARATMEESAASVGEVAGVVPTVVADLAAVGGEDRLVAIAAVALEAGPAASPKAAVAWGPAAISS